MSVVLLAFLGELVGVWATITNNKLIIYPLHIIIGKAYRVIATSEHSLEHSKPSFLTSTLLSNLYLIRFCGQLFCHYMYCPMSTNVRNWFVRVFDILQISCGGDAKIEATRPFYRNFGKNFGKF